MGLSPSYAPTYTASPSAEAARVPSPRQVGPELHDLVKGQVRAGWINVFNYQLTRKLPSGNPLGMKQDMYDSSPNRQDKDTEEI